MREASDRRFPENVWGVRTLMRLADENSWISLSYLSGISAFLLYPSFLAPIGPNTNGGALGLLAILLATGFTWIAFALNRSRPKPRVAIQLPMTALITFLDNLGGGHAISTCPRKLPVVLVSCPAKQ